MDDWLRLFRRAAAPHLVAALDDPEHYRERFERLAAAGPEAADGGA